MKRFLQQLLGDGAGNDKTRRPDRTRRLEIEPFSHGLVRIPALDFFGPHAGSSNGRYHLIWQDRNPEGTIGGHRYKGHGTWSLLTDGGALLAKGRLERPQDGHVADFGTFILSDWMFGDGLKGRLLAFGADGRDVAANGDDIWSQAKALRLRGEMHEQAGEVDEAIASYEQALAIDPQVGVSRRHKRDFRHP